MTHLPPRSSRIDLAELSVVASVCQANTAAAPPAATSTAALVLYNANAQITPLAVAAAGDNQPRTA